MHKPALAAVALIGVSALTGSAIPVGSAAVAAPTIQTKTLVLHGIRAFPSGGLTTVGVDRMHSHGRLVGFDSYSNKAFQTSGKHVAWVGFALRGGMIMARLTERAHGIHGPIISGAGKYRGIIGTVTDRRGPNATEIVTLTYHF
jgi:hypothetical protein